MSKEKPGGHETVTEREQLRIVKRATTAAMLDAIEDADNRPGVRVAIQARRDELAEAARDPEPPRKEPSVVQVIADDEHREVRKEVAGLVLEARERIGTRNWQVAAAKASKAVGLIPGHEEATELLERAQAELEAAAEKPCRKCDFYKIFREGSNMGQCFEARDGPPTLKEGSSTCGEWRKRQAG